MTPLPTSCPRNVIAADKMLKSYDDSRSQILPSFSSHNALLYALYPHQIMYSPPFKLALLTGILFSLYSLSLAAFVTSPKLVPRGLDPPNLGPHGPQLDLLRPDKRLIRKLVPLSNTRGPHLESPTFWRAFPHHWNDARIERKVMRHLRCASAVGTQKPTVSRLVQMLGRSSSRHDHIQAPARAASAVAAIKHPEIMRKAVMATERLSRDHRWLAAIIAHDDRESAVLRQRQAQQERMARDVGLHYAKFFSGGRSIPMAWWH